MTANKSQRKISSRFVAGNCLGMAAVAFLFTVGTLVGLNFYTHHGEEIEVPALSGMDARSAMKKLESVGLEGVVGDTGYVAREAADVVLEQSIAPGARVKAGRIVRLTVNAGRARPIALPDLAGNCSLREAVLKLQSLGFRTTPPEYVPGDRDWVYAVKLRGRTLASGEKVPAGSPLTIVAGEGEQEEIFNGDDSLDFVIFGDEEGEASEIMADEF